MDANSLLAKLKNDAALEQLAELSLDAQLDQTMGALLPEAEVAKALRAAIEGWVRSPQALPGLTKVVEDAVAQLQADGRALKDVLPAELKELTRNVLKRPWSPDRKLVLTVIDRPPVRELVRALLMDTVVEFGRRASAPVAGVASALGGFAKLAMGTAKEKSGTFGALVGAVGGEVERQVEKRASDFVDYSLSKVIGQIADSISDPKKAKEAAELRAALYEGVLELTQTQLSRELMNLDVPGGAEVVRDGLERWVSSPGADAVFAGLANDLNRQYGARTLRAVLEEAGQLQTFRTFGKSALKKRMGEIVATDTFAAWLDALMK